jgi:hypothetical protein
MLLLSFFDTGITEVPEALAPRGRAEYYYIGLILFASFSMLAMVRRSNSRFFSVLIQLFLTATNLEQRLKDSMRLGSFASIVLVINYLVIFSVCFYFTLGYLNWFGGWVNLIISIVIPIILFVIQIVPVFFISGITDSGIPVVSVTANTLIGLQLGGIFLSLIALIWSLNPEFAPMTLIAFVSVISVIQFSRLFKNSFAVLSSGVSWYYIVLYFCTLEILPLFVAYYYVKLNFMN